MYLSDAELAMLARAGWFARQMCPYSRARVPPNTQIVKCVFPGIPMQLQPGIKTTVH